MACSSFSEGDGEPKDDASSPADGNGVDSGTAGDGSTNDAESGLRCDPTKPFESVLKVDGVVNTMENETYAIFSEDERTIYFSRGAGTNRDIWRATRTVSSAAFANAEKYAPANSSYLDDGLTFSSDGLLGVLATGRPGGNAPNLFFMTRPAPGDGFTMPKEIPGINSPTTTVNENDPYLLPNKMYFTSDRDGDSDIFEVSVTAGPSFGSPVKVDEVSSGFSDGAPVASQDDMEMFIASGRLSNGGVGGTVGERTLLAKRPAPGMKFGTPVDVPELNVQNTSAIPSWLSADRCVLLFSSDRDGNRDIWVAKRGR